MSNLEYKEFYRRNLPHLQIEGAILFITYRVKFDIPDHIKKKLRNISLKKRYHQNSNNLLATNRLIDNSYDQFITQFDIIDEFLSKYNNDSINLIQDQMGSIISDSLKYLNNRMIELYTYCIMPNHVHLLMKPLKKDSETYYSIAEIMKLHKGFTAREINKVMNRKGQLWHHESYDHIVRNDREFKNIILYILNNPVKADLCEKIQQWKYSWICDECKDEFEM